MAVRGCVTLLFILLSGIVHADDLVTSPLPAIQELSTSKILSSTSSPTTFKHSSTATSATVATEVPTAHYNTTNSTTETSVTTVAPTSSHHNTTNSTTEPPTTTHHNTTNSTTEAPTTAHTNATTAPTPSTTTPHPTTPPVPNPTVGNYSVKSDNVTDCLLAKMGLQFSFKISENASFQTLNLDPSPNATEASGTCGSGGNDSSLLLKSEETTIHFVFTNVSQKFRLHALTFSVNLGNGSVFNASNNNLSLWVASVGSSYMCRKEQSYNITDKLTLNTFELQVQPFAVQNNKFNTAHECSMDDTSLLIPIIVGAALAGLIFIVVIAYVIGRRRTYVGYQTL